MQSRGVWGLYRGAVPSVLRAFITSGTRFSTYEFVIATLSRWNTLPQTDLGQVSLGGG